ncbi:hypothetical protein [Mycolicibacterium fortuitum]|uniref:hypothetical protein n=1 Tax=Mycolicibacterium fortuitum TaxID=1766 RepID=UPI002604B21C|nr:hypothetical protein [Mycolicibacterium fortuitum]
MSIRVYPDTGHYDLDLSSSGSGWVGTYSLLVRQVVADITMEGPFGPVEITYDDGQKTVTGVLHGFGFGDDTISIDGLLVEIERIVRFRA